MSDDQLPDSSAAEASVPKANSIKRKKKNHSSPIIPIFVVLLLAGGLAVYFYTDNQQAPVEKTDAESESAMIGIPPEPQPIVVEPEPTPAAQPESEPLLAEPVEIQFSDLTQRKDLWPRTLELTNDIALEIIYNGESFGEMVFTAGQAIQLNYLETPAQLVGKIGGQHLSIPVQKTNLGTWFEANHAEDYILTDLNALSATADPHGKITNNDELYNELERWCLLNFGDCRLDIGEDKLVLHWKKQHGPVNYNEEATILAHHYLKLQAQRNQGDNYAPCEIVDLRSGQSLGFSVAFRPAGVELN